MSSTIPTSRRAFLETTGMGIGGLALAGLLNDEVNADVRTDSKNPLIEKPTHFAPRAKNIIHLFMNGGPSHVDTFDYKPALEKLHGQQGPTHRKTERPTGTVMKSPWKFRPYGESGIFVSEIFDQVGECVDDICFINSMHAEVPNHEPSLMLMNCGTSIGVRPSVGSWLNYGLGTANQNLPGFVVICADGRPIKQAQNWTSAFLPGVYQGTHINPNRPKNQTIIDHLKNPTLTKETQRTQLDLMQQWNRIHREQAAEDAALDARIQSYELAFRMQTEATDVFDVSREPEHIHELYGTKGNRYAHYTLMARRLVERGVRYVQVYQGAGQPWDSHNNIAREHGNLAKATNQAIAALIKDLKQRGMLDDTIVMWGGEFGRTPTVEVKSGINPNADTGRDHNHHGFTVWLAGGGVKGGFKYGATDELGWYAADNPVEVHDLHATLLHLMGLDHKRLTYRYAGRDFRLTDVHGHVLHDIIA